MKVDLEKITLGHSPLTDSIFAGTIIKQGVWRNKVNVTEAFLNCAISLWGGKKGKITSEDGEEWEITVKKIK